MPDYYEELEEQLTKAEADLAQVTAERDSLSRILEEQHHATRRITDLARREVAAVSMALGIPVEATDFHDPVAQARALVAERDELRADRSYWREEAQVARKEALALESRQNRLQEERDELRAFGIATERRWLKADELHQQAVKDLAVAQAQIDALSKAYDMRGDKLVSVAEQRDKYLAENIMLRSTADHLQDANTYMADRLKAIRQALGGYPGSDLVSLATTMRARLAHLLAAIHEEADDGEE